jgi:hypothetical protein
MTQQKAFPGELRIITSDPSKMPLIHDKNEIGGAPYVLVKLARDVLTNGKPHVFRSQPAAWVHLVTNECSKASGTNNAPR